MDLNISGNINIIGNVNVKENIKCENDIEINNINVKKKSTFNECETKNTNITNANITNANITDANITNISSNNLSVNSVSFYAGPATIHLITDNSGDKSEMYTGSCTCFKYKNGNNYYLNVSGTFYARSIINNVTNHIYSIDTGIGTYYASSRIDDVIIPGNFIRRYPETQEGFTPYYKDIYYGHLAYDNKQGKPVYTWRTDNQSWMKLYNKDALTIYNLVFKDKNE